MTLSPAAYSHHSWIPMSLSSVAYNHHSELPILFIPPFLAVLRIQDFLQENIFAALWVNNLLIWLNIDVCQQEGKRQVPQNLPSIGNGCLSIKAVISSGRNRQSHASGYPRFPGYLPVPVSGFCFLLPGSGRGPIPVLPAWNGKPGSYLLIIGRINMYPFNMMAGSSMMLTTPDSSCDGWRKKAYPGVSPLTL